MDKFSSDMVKQAYDLGFELFGIMKAASEGDVDASSFIKEAMEAAGADPSMMGAVPPAPEVAPALPPRILTRAPLPVGPPVPPYIRNKPPAPDPSPRPDCMKI